MEGEKSKKKNKADKEGLSKKERRALVVQEKTKNVPDKIVDSQKGVQTQPTEKELRKLEWEKKLAEQKAQPGKEKESLSKAELKAKRREQQEAQRQAKTAVVQEEPKKPDEKVLLVKKVVVVKPKQESRKLEFVTHLYTDPGSVETIVNYKNVHPAFVRLGVQYSTKVILGSNARCRSLLTAVKYLVRDLQTPPKQEFCRYLETVLNSCVEHLNKCRPLAVSMNNALRYFKTELLKVEQLQDNVKKETLLDIIDTYILDQIDKAGESISLKVKEKICDGDVVLIFGCSSLIRRILSDAHSQSKKFKVIVVDGRPFFEGRQMLQRLVQTGLNCSYVQMNGLTYVMNMVTKVLLGAHALLTNGYVMSRIGTAQVALVAQAYNKPVLVCCETYKFSEQVLTDSFVFNELGPPEALSNMDNKEENSPLATIRNNEKLQILNLLYDVTPPDLITAVVTELAILPCTSAPVVLRVKP